MEDAEVVTVALTDVPEHGCIAVGAADAVLLTRTGDDVRAYVNRCLHVGRPLHEGVVRDGVLTCPHHLWRYRLRDGAAVAGGASASGGGLAGVEVEVDDGHVRVRVLNPPAASLREQLLAHARTWRRDAP